MIIILIPIPELSFPDLWCRRDYRESPLANEPYSIGHPIANANCGCNREFVDPLWERAKVSHKRVFALLTPEIRGWKMAQML